VTDIEGTTGSIAFVRDVLFPYAHERLAEFVTRRHDDPLVVEALRETALIANESGASPERLVAILRGWIDADRKVTPLKTLQGLIWASGYEDGVLAGHVYPDAAETLRRWHAAGIALYVYSSGSIAAQKLLFGHSTAGDLTPLFRGYFDTTIGAKGDAESYRRIAAAIALEPADIVFLSDRSSELDAAASAGWQVALVTRPDEPAVEEAPSRFPAFASFDEITIAR